MREIKEILLCGAENALTAAELAAILEVDSREVTRQISHLRKRGLPICAAVSGECRGYFLAADERELERYLRSLRRRVREIRAACSALEDELVRLSGQTIIWDGEAE